METIETKPRKGKLLYKDQQFAGVADAESELNFEVV